MSGARAGRRKTRQRLPAPATSTLAAPPAPWLKTATLLLTAVCLLGLFSTEIADTDFWWHLKTGQYIVERHSLPVPDPFAYTTPVANGQRGEQRVRHFNLTHEWLSQALMYVVYAAAGFPGIILSRAVLLASLCGLAGFLAARLSANFYAGIAAACGTGSVLVAFAADRPGVVSFLGVAVFVSLLEAHRDAAGGSQTAEELLSTATATSLCASSSDAHRPRARGAVQVKHSGPGDRQTAKEFTLPAGTAPLNASSSKAHRAATGGRHTAEELLSTDGAAPLCASSSEAHRARAAGLHREEELRISRRRAPLYASSSKVRRGWWALPALAVLWSNCHGGFPLGWVVLLVYCGETLLSRPRVTPDNRRLWLITACAIAASGINPNGFSVVSTLFAYRRSPMTANLIEWQPPKLWGPPYGFDILLYAAALVLVLSWRRVRPAHWILFAVFAAASLAAFRNIPLIGFLAPVLIAAYFPFRVRVLAVLAWASPILAAAALAAGLAQGWFHQFRVAAWTIPTGAADYLLEHHVTGPMFNTYEQGGYLIWRVWPEERVFIDGRSLSESLYRDYNRILVNAGSPADQVVGPREELLNRYGIQVVVMNTMDYVSGALYPLAIALANPASTEWELVYDDSQAVIFLRRPPPGLPALSNKLGRVLRHLDTECAAYIENSPDTPWCARTLADYWLRNQAKDAARRMLLLYLSHAPRRDEKAERALHNLDAAPPP